jgi:hypothetical protein
MAVSGPLSELEAAYSQQRPPRFNKNVAAWAFAVNDLLASDRLGIAEHAVRHLHAAFPTLAYARNLCAVFDRMPRADAAEPGFKNDPTKDVQIVARNSELVVLLFCGKAGGLGIPLPMVHPWLAQLPASLVYLRDFRSAHYLHGIESLGPTRDATLTALRRIITSLNGRRIVCFGNCGGVFGALDYGLDLGVDAVLCMSGHTNLMPDSNIPARSAAKALALNVQFPDACLDMRELYSRAENPPRVCIAYGKNFWDDRIQAEHMSTLSCVTPYALEDCAEHNLIVELISRGEFQGLLDWLIRSPEHVDGVRLPPIQDRAING